MQQKQHADQRDDSALLQQGLLQRGNGLMDQLGAIIGGDYLHPLGQAELELHQLLLHPLDDIERIFTAASHDNAGGHLSLPIELGHPSSLIGYRLDAGDIGNAHRGTVHFPDHQLAQILHMTKVALASHHELGFRQFDDPTADILITVADDLHHLQRREAVTLQLAGIQHHLILLDEAADAGDLGHPGRRRQRVTEGPILQGAQGLQRLTKPLPLILGHQGVLIDPTHTAGIRPQRRTHSDGQLAGESAQILQHPGASPVEIGVLFKDHVNKGGAEEGKAPHHLGLGHRQQGGCQRVGHLILHHLRRLPRVFGVDDHLNI